MPMGEMTGAQAASAFDTCNYITRVPSSARPPAPALPAPPQGSAAVCRKGDARAREQPRKASDATLEASSGIRQPLHGRQRFGKAVGAFQQRPPGGLFVSPFNILYHRGLAASPCPCCLIAASI